MAFSKGKRQLAELLIAAGVTKFPDGANWAAQGSVDLKASFYDGYKPKRGFGETAFCGNYCGSLHDVQLPSLIPNWHQTVLSRNEFDQVVEESLNLDKYCESVTHSVHVQPTFDQLLQDWRNAADYAARKQAEADEAAALRDQRWGAVRDRGVEFGVVVVCND